jgi:hypothetical protein
LWLTIHFEKAVKHALFALTVCSTGYKILRFR